MSDLVAGDSGRVPVRRLGDQTGPRVLLITRDFPPISHSGTLRSEAFARYLPEFGVEPVVLTAQPAEARSLTGIDQHFASGWRDGSHTPSVRRIDWTNQERPATKPLRRVLNRIPLLASYAQQRHLEAHVDKLLAAAREVVEGEDLGVVYASAPPPETVALAVRLGEAFDVPVVADLRDLSTHNPSPPFRHWVDFRLAVRRQRRLLGRCARVIVNTQVAADIVRKEFQVPGNRVELVYNGYDEQEFEGLEPAAPIERGKFLIVHAGQLTLGGVGEGPLARRAKRLLGFDYDPLSCDFRARSPDYVLAALEQFLVEHPDAPSQIRICFVGLNEPRESPAIRDFRFPQCLQVLPRVSSREAAALCCRADLLLLLQYQYRRWGRDCCVAIPAKLFTYLRTGKRILALVQPSEIADLIRAQGAGVVAPPTNVAAIKEALGREFERWRSAGRQAPNVGPRAGIERFERRALTGQLAQILRDVAPPVRRPAVATPPVGSACSS